MTNFDPQFIASTYVTKLVAEDRTYALLTQSDQLAWRQTRATEISDANRLIQAHLDMVGSANIPSHPRGAYNRIVRPFVEAFWHAVESQAWHPDLMQEAKHVFDEEVYG